MVDKSEIAGLGPDDSTVTTHQSKNLPLFFWSSSFDQASERKNVVFAKGLFFKRRLNWSEMSDREISCNHSEIDLPDNSISTSKYTLLSFVPKNLFLQFSKMANLYFLVSKITHLPIFYLIPKLKFIGVMQCINIISISGGRPVIYMPLSVIVAITALKDMFEDLKRHKSDNEENNRKVSVFRNGGFMETAWKELRVGEVIKVPLK